MNRAEALSIVVVSLVDDNYGDVAIRITFQSLLAVALQNHGLDREDYAITPMSLKHIDEELIESADAILFAGGGLFGLSYLDFFRHVDRITELADRRGTPIIFSSMGMNNMDADGNTDAFVKILSRGCVKAIAVRENLTLFREAAADVAHEVTQIADPAVWTRYVYGMADVKPDGWFGINVVRGGLFAANGGPWGLTAELKYLHGLMERAEANGLDVRLFTNGSLDDNNTLRFFVQKYGIPDAKVVLPQTTREVVEAIASCSAIASIRMHSSIIAYSFDIPTVGLAWNEKLGHFYEAIGHPERLLPVNEWTPDRAFGVLQSAGVAPDQNPRYREYLMSTYEFVHRVVGEHVVTGHSNGAATYSFDEVANELATRAEEIQQDENDLRFKLGKAERAYLARFVSLRHKDAKIAELTAQVDEMRSAEKGSQSGGISDSAHGQTSEKPRPGTSKATIGSGQVQEIRELAEYADDRGNRIFYEKGAVPNAKFFVRFRGERNTLRIHRGAKIVDLKADFVGDDGLLEIEATTKPRKGILLTARLGYECTVSIGPDTGFETPAFISAAEGASVTIGEDCMFATAVELRVDDSHAIYDVRTGKRANPSRDISIGNHVWLGKHVVVMSGATIGDGSVIGFRSIVTRDIPNNCVAAGAPARVVRRDVAWERPLLAGRRPGVDELGPGEKKTESWWNLTEVEAAMRE
ncbi:polysaccharide pyruvyl transferase family protein [Microbacterium sp.]|uniref:polysaccharide pyruvyl transferase family protein n=1 Tax=Microbacterium sp. TaxID=51671 RepID=UPI0028A8E6EC|nr:polysaccharide pyruvyl transferase family protein [Microbacterium sp.]